MQRVNNFNFYMMGYVLHPLSQFTSGKKLKMRDIFFDLITARDWIQHALDGKLGCSISVCRPAAYRAVEAIGHVVPEGSPLPKVDLEQELEYWGGGIYGVVSAIKEFETVFSAEMQAADTYHVSQKGIYSTAQLIDSAENMFAPAVKSVLSEQTVTDLQQAGRCLAFECPTAAGFHILRAVEDVLRDYYEVVTGVQPKKKLRSWAAYVKRLEGAGASKKVIGILDQIRDLHRNPVFHPEDNLSVDEAATLLGIAQSAIVAMVLEMKNKQSGSLPLAQVVP